jgi:hypothetical protein
MPLRSCYKVNVRSVTRLLGVRHAPHKRVLDLLHHERVVVPLCHSASSAAYYILESLYVLLQR